MLTALTSKTARTALWFLLLCGALAVVRHRERLGLIEDWRFAVVRELLAEEQDADLLFLGTSRTARGIQPVVVEERLAELGDEAEAVNLAIVGIARPIAYLLLKDWLRTHAAPRVVFVETSLADATEWPHQRAADFLGPREALRVALERPYRFASQSAFGAWRDAVGFDPGGFLRGFERARLNVELGVEALGAGPGSCAQALWNRIKSRRAGRGDRPYWRSAEVADLPEILPETLATQVAARGWYREETSTGREQVSAIAAADDPPTYDVPFDDPDRFRAVKRYTELLVELCRERGIRLVFLHLPGFRETTSPAHRAYHAALAEVFTLEPEVASDPTRYADAGHLSPQGAAWYSKELAEWLFTHPR